MGKRVWSRQGELSGLSSTLAEKPLFVEVRPTADQVTGWRIRTGNWPVQILTEKYQCRASGVRDVAGGRPDRYTARHERADAACQEGHQAGSAFRQFVLRLPGRQSAASGSRRPFGIPVGQHVRLCMLMSLLVRLTNSQIEMADGMVSQVLDAVDEEAVFSNRYAPLGCRSMRRRFSARSGFPSY